MSNKSHYLGIDIGSTTFKAVLMSGDGKVERTVYRRTQPVESGKVACTGHCSACGCCSGGSVKKLALEFLRAAGISFKDVDAIVVTGSQIVEDTRRFIPFDFQVSEVTAHVAGAKFLHPDVDAIIDCGGQDSKCMVYNPTMKLWTSMMSGVCAAGTGSFLDSVAQKLGVKVEDVADKVNYESNTEFSSVCAVLSATSINKFKNRVPIGDLLAGACKAQARTILNSVGQLLVNAPGRKILFQGGVAFNKAVAFFLKKLTGSEIVIPQYHEVMGALGAAVIAMRLHDLREKGKLDLAKVEYEPTRGKSTLLRIKSTKRDFFSHDPSKPLVWRNLFFPAEILNAMGCRIRTLETYAALFGRRADKVKEALGKAAQKGFDGQTCSFLRMLEGMELDKPDFVVSTVQPCQQAERVFADLVREHGIPDRLYSLQTPVNSQARNAVEMVADGLAEAVSEMEKAFGRKLDPGRLEEACVLSNEAADLARKCADLRFTSPPLVRGSEAIYNAVVFSVGRAALLDRRYPPPAVAPPAAVLRHQAPRLHRDHLQRADRLRGDELRGLGTARPEGPLPLSRAQAAGVRIPRPRAPRRVREARGARRPLQRRHPLHPRLRPLLARRPRALQAPPRDARLDRRAAPRA